MCMCMRTHDRQMMVTETSKATNLRVHFFYKMLHWLAILFISITFFLLHKFFPGGLRQATKQPPY